MKKVLITGCSGYIGSHLAKMLMNSMKYEVHGLDIRDPQQPMHKFYRQDINRLFTLNKEFDCVIHLAALVKVNESEQMPIPYYITNLNGTMNVINKIKTKNFVFASTGAAESCVSAYGVSKRAAEDVVREYYTQHKPTPYTIFRFYNVIGSSGFEPTNPDGLMYNLLKSSYTREFTIYGDDYNTVDGTCVRDYVHVDEVCDALMTAIEKSSNQIECLGHGVGHTVAEMFEMFKTVNHEALYAETLTPILRKIGPRRKGDIESSVLSNVSSYMKNLYSFEELLKLPRRPQRKVSHDPILPRNLLVPE